MTIPSILSNSYTPHLSYIVDKASINQTAREIEIQLMAFKSYVKCEISNINQKKKSFHECLSNAKSNAKLGKECTII